MILPERDITQQTFGNNKIKIVNDKTPVAEKVPNQAKLRWVKKE